MTRKIHCALAVVALLLVSPLWALDDHQEHTHDRHAQHHAGKHGDVGMPELTLDEGQRWATDASLRQGMSDLRTAFETAHSAFERDALDREQAEQLADTIDDRVQFMFANCKLPPDADAELHKLLAAIMGAAVALRESDDVHDGLHRLHQAIDIYPEYFDHPGWGA